MQTNIKTKNQIIFVKSKNYCFEIFYSKSSENLEDAKELSALAKEEKRAEIAQSSARFELAGQERDPDVEYFNEYMYILDTISSLGKIWEFDTGSGKFFDRNSEE